MIIWGGWYGKVIMVGYVVGNRSQKLHNILNCVFYWELHRNTFWRSCTWYISVIALLECNNKDKGGQSVSQVCALWLSMKSALKCTKLLNSNMTASLHKQCYSIHCTHSFTFQKRVTPVCVNFTCSTGPVLSITRILNIEPALSFAGAFTFCRTKLKVNMNQVHSVRNVCEKCQGNAANHSRVKSCTKLEVTDGRTDS